MIVYHGAFQPFQGCPTSKKIFGLHVGTLAASLDRIDHIIQNKNDKGRTPHIYKITLHPNKILAGVVDAGIWQSPRDVAYVLKKKLGENVILPNKPWYDLPFDNEKEASKYLKKMLNKLLSMGYDTISYRNRYEDKGKVSYIILDPSIITSCVEVNVKNNPPATKEEKPRPGPHEAHKVILRTPVGLDVYIYELKNNRILRERKEYDPGERSTYRSSSQYMSRLQANEDIKRKKAKGWIEILRNPIIDPGPEFFIQQAHLRQIQKQYLQETGQHISIPDLKDFLINARARALRKSFRRVK